MKSLKFVRLVLVSDTTRSANQFTFQKRYNLITGKNNSIGKSSLLKNLFWALGCEPDFDQNWKALDCKALLEFEIGSDKYLVTRYKDIIVFGKKDGVFKKYYTISGEYSELLSKIVNFKAKLPNRSEVPELEVPPPSYYFLPFYIDQIRSWSSPWDSFVKLGQYASWKATIVKYHTGYLVPKYFAIEDEIYELKHARHKADQEIKRINTAIDVVEQYVPKTVLAMNKEEFEEITAEVETALGDLAKEQEELFNSISETQSIRYHLLNQLEIAERAVSEIEKDYIFTVENLEGDEIECPLCGTMHDNSLVNRASILADKQQAEDQVVLLTVQVRQLESQIDDQSRALKIVRKKISDLNERYRKRSDTGEEQLNLNMLVDSFASRAVQRNVRKTKTEKESFSKRTVDKQKELKKDQKKLFPNKRRAELSDLFLGFFSEFIEKLDARGINLNKVKHPTDYNKIFGSGGAAESTRAVLAYQIAVFRQIYAVSNETPAPLVIDTPNQQEQAGKNYELIIKLIMNDTPESSQILLCGMDNEKLVPYKEKAKTIQIGEEKILIDENYDKLSKEVSSILFRDYNI